jgi:hypothetical protein
MPDLVRLLFEAKNLGAVTAARIIVVAGAVQFVVGWSKSFAVTAGRPQWRIWTHGIETVVLLPLAVLLGWKWGAAGAASAVLVSSIVFAMAWAVLIGGSGVSLPSASQPRSPWHWRPGASVNVLVVSGIWPPDVGPASHAPQVASFLQSRGWCLRRHHRERMPAASRSRWVSRRCRKASCCEPASRRAVLPGRCRLHTDVRSKRSGSRAFRCPYVIKRPPTRPSNALGGGIVSVDQFCSRRAA